MWHQSVSVRPYLRKIARKEIVMENADNKALNSTTAIVSLSLQIRETPMQSLWTWETSLIGHDNETIRMTG